MTRRRVPWALVALASLSIAWTTSTSDFGHRLEHGVADIGGSFLRHEIASDVVIVGIDAKSLAEIDQWPWPRRHHAALIDKLSAAPPRQLLLDIDFSSNSNPVDDALLVTALANWEGEPVILPAFFQYESSTSPKLILTEPLEALRAQARVASVNIAPGDDGLIRTVPRRWTGDHRSLPAAAVMLNGLTAQTDADIVIDFTIDPSSFMYLSYSDIVSNRTPAEYFADKIVFVGATAIELGDMLPVPIYKSLPGVVVQALAYESVRLGQLRSPDATWYWFFVTAWCLIVGYWLCRQSWQRNILIVTASIFSILAAALYLYATFDLVVAVVPPILGTLAAFVLATLRSLEAETLRAVMYAVGYRRRNALLKSIVLSSTDCIVCIDAAGDIQTVNPAATKLFSGNARELIGASIFTLIPKLKSDDGVDQQQLFDRISDSVLEYNACALSGGNFPVELSISRVRLNDEILYTAIVRDISDRKAQQRQLQFQATHDPLTTLPNRPALAAHLDACLGRQAGNGRVALLMIDLDRFKEVNDTLGHNVGDHVLYEVARRLAAVADGRGFLARIGGDEFALVVDRIDDAPMISELSSDLADCLKQPIQTSGIAIEVGLSIGIALYPDDAKDAETLFKFSDVAMYSAKRTGVDFEYYDSANDRHSVRKLTIVTRLRNAIENSELQLHYQPQVNLKTGQVESVEALLRWQDSVLGTVSPAEFIELAEATDLIQPLSDWTLRQALLQALRWHKEGLNLRIAINVSARILQDIGFPERMSDLMNEIGVHADQIELEITESAMMVDPHRALQVAHGLSQLGLLISIDDYGTGYSSLAYLRDLPVHALKLDQSFVTNMHEQKENRVIVESTVQMAHALSLVVVAEGVETCADATMLCEYGYDFAQGFLYSCALPGDELAAWVGKFNSPNARLDLCDVARIV